MVPAWPKMNHLGVDEAYVSLLSPPARNQLQQGGKCSVHDSRRELNHGSEFSAADELLFQLKNSGTVAVEERPCGENDGPQIMSTEQLAVERRNSQIPPGQGNEVIGIGNKRLVRRYPENVMSGNGRAASRKGLVSGKVHDCLAEGEPQHQGQSAVPVAFYDGAFRHILPESLNMAHDIDDADRRHLPVP